MDNNQNIELTPKKYIKTLSMIHIALIVGVIIFSVVSYFLNENPVFNLDFESDVFILIVPFAAIGGVYASIFIGNKKINELSKIDSLKSKLSGYQTASIIKYALIEGPALLGIIKCMETANLFYLAVTGLLVIYYLSLRPTKAKIENDLNLNHEHQSAFNQLDEVIS